MPTILQHGVDNRQTFEFTCSKCGCVYTAKEDEGTTVHKSMGLECQMTFCKTRNVSSQLFNEGGQS